MEAHAADLAVQTLRTAALAAAESAAVQSAAAKPAAEPAAQSAAAQTAAEPAAESAAAQTAAEPAAVSVSFQLPLHEPFLFLANSRRLAKLATATTFQPRLGSGRQTRSAEPNGMHKEWRARQAGSAAAAAAKDAATDSPGVPEAAHHATVLAHARSAATALSARRAGVAHDGGRRVKTGNGA
jgi:hypothetical protein